MARSSNSGNVAATYAAAAGTSTNQASASNPPPSAALEQVQNPLSPYYLHPSESSGITIVSEVLNGDNYHAWSRAVSNILKSKNKIPFIDGSLPPPPPTDELHQAWHRCNTTVLAWITRSLSPSITRSILWFELASEVWADLYDRFYQGDRFRISDLQEEIAAVRQGDLSVTDYFTQLKSLWSELQNFRPLPRCTCVVKCSCNALIKVKSYLEEDYVIRFLKGLNDSYSNVKSQILLLDPLPPVSKVFNMVIQQERQDLY